MIAVMTKSVLVLDIWAMSYSIRYNWVNPLHSGGGWRGSLLSKFENSHSEKCFWPSPHRVPSSWEGVCWVIPAWSVFVVPAYHMRPLGRGP